MESTNYIDNSELTRHIEIFRKSYDRKIKKGKITDELGEMFVKIAYNLANKKNFANYTYKEEMISRGIVFMCQYGHNFNYKINTHYLCKSKKCQKKFKGTAHVKQCKFCGFKKLEKTKGSSNAFAYLSQICFNGFVQALKEEGKHSKLKDKLIKQSMDNPIVDEWNEEHNSN